MCECCAQRLRPYLYAGKPKGRTIRVRGRFGDAGEPARPSTRPSELVVDATEPGERLDQVLKEEGAIKKQPRRVDVPRD